MNVDIAIENLDVITIIFLLFYFVMIVAVYVLINILNKRVYRKLKFSVYEIKYLLIIPIVINIVNLLKSHKVLIITDSFYLLITGISGALIIIMSLKVLRKLQAVYKIE